VEVLTLTAFLPLTPFKAAFLAAVAPLVVAKDKRVSKFDQVNNIMRQQVECDGV